MRWSSDIVDNAASSIREEVFLYMSADLRINIYCVYVYRGVRKNEKTKNYNKDKNEAKKLRFKDILVKIMFNLECGNIRNC